MKLPKQIDYYELVAPGCRVMLRKGATPENVANRILKAFREPDKKWLNYDFCLNIVNRIIDNGIEQA